jgi:hypothetical protein
MNYSKTFRKSSDYVPNPAADTVIFIFLFVLCLWLVPYTLNFWLGYAGKAQSVNFIHGTVAFAILEFLGAKSRLFVLVFLPCATWVASLFL